MFISYPKPMTSDQLLRMPETATFWHVDTRGVTAYRLSDRDKRVVKSDDKTLALTFLSDGDDGADDLSSLYFGNGDVFLRNAYASEQDARRVYALCETITSEELTYEESLRLFERLTNGDAHADAIGYVLSVRGFADDMLRVAFTEGEQGEHGEQVAP